MKVLVQWSKSNPEDWVEIDSSKWKDLPKKPEPRNPIGTDEVDTSNGWIYAINVQGVIFGEADHFAVEELDSGGVKVISWVTDSDDWADGEKWAIEHFFEPLQPDENFGNAVNTKQTRIIYGEPNALIRLKTNAPTDTFKDLSEFIAPVDEITRHGIWVSDTLAVENKKIQTICGWREWCEHLSDSEVDIIDGKRILKSQRDLGRWNKAKGTITYYQRDTDRAVTAFTATNENALEKTTASAVTETYEVPLAEDLQNDYPVWNFATDTNEPNSSDWPDGDYRIQYDITELDSGVRITYTNFYRINSDATSNLEKIGVDNTDITTTGLTIHSITVNPASGSASDRYDLLAYCTNDNAHGLDQTITLELNTSDSFADGPWTPPAVTEVKYGYSDAFVSIDYSV